MRGNTRRLISRRFRINTCGMKENSKEDAWLGTA
jgi:hypothetical protein